MSQKDLAMAASPATQAAIAASGGSVANLATMAAQAEAASLKAVLERAVAAATSILQGANARASELVSEANALAKSVEKNAKASAELAKARVYYSATNNIFPLQKVIGIPTATDVLREFPDIDKIPDGWTAPAATVAS